MRSVNVPNSAVLLGKGRLVFSASCRAGRSILVGERAADFGLGSSAMDRDCSLDMFVNINYRRWELMISMKISLGDFVFQTKEELERNRNVENGSCHRN